MDLSIVEDCIVYFLLIGILTFIYVKYIYPRIHIEGFASPSLDLVKVKSRIEQEISEVRKKSPSFFTQNASAPTLPPNQSFLVNICPLTGYLGGYLGPPEHLMDASYYLTMAFNAGVRSFVLPVSTYINASKEPPNWPYSGEPALVCRDSSDIIISENGLTIKTFVDNLIKNKSISGFGSDPIFLFIEDAISEVDRKKIDYVSFMKKIASALSPLDPYRLTTAGSYGSVVGGLQQKKLLTEIPLSTFSNKIILFTNFDTSQDADLTLASYANFIYSTDDTLPVRTVGLENLVGTTVNYITNTRINWHIAKSSGLSAPSLTNVQLALENGMQCIPIPLLSTPMNDIKDIWSLWKGASYRLKPEKARYTQPDPVVPSRPSEKLNASIQGQPPGNLVVN